MILDSQELMDPRRTQRYIYDKQLRIKLLHEICIEILSLIKENEELLTKNEDIFMKYFFKREEEEEDLNEFIRSLVLDKSTDYLKEIFYIDDEIIKIISNRMVREYLKPIYALITNVYKYKFLFYSSETMLNKIKEDIQIKIRSGENEIYRNLNKLTIEIKEYLSEKIKSFNDLETRIKDLCKKVASDDMLLLALLGLLHSFSCLYILGLSEDITVKNEELIDLVNSLKREIKDMNKLVYDLFQDRNEKAGKMFEKTVFCRVLEIFSQRQNLHEKYVLLLPPIKVRDVETDGLIIFFDNKGILLVLVIESKINVVNKSEIEKQMKRLKVVLDGMFENKVKYALITYKGVNINELKELFDIVIDSFMDPKNDKILAEKLENIVENL